MSSSLHELVLMLLKSKWGFSQIFFFFFFSMWKSLESEDFRDMGPLLY